MDTQFITSAYRRITRLTKLLFQTPLGWQSQVFLVILSLCVHLPFIFWHSMGEQDQARFILDALHWKALGSPFDLSYRVRTSPLYILLLHGIARSFNVHTDGLIVFTTMLSLVSSLAIIPLFISIGKHLQLKARSILAALLVLQLMPAFWFSSLYGFATMPAMAFLMIACISYFKYFKSSRLKHRVLWLATTFLFFIVGALTKIDCLVAGSGLFGIAFFCTARRRLILESGMLLGLAAFTFFFGNSLGGAIEAVSMGNTDFWQSTFHTYPIVPFHFLHPVRVHWIFRAYGMFMFPLAIGSLIVSLAHKGIQRKRAMLCMAWFTPLLLFWTSHTAIAARELLCTSVAIALSIGLLMESFRPRVSSAIIVTVWFAGLLAVRPTSQTYFPSARLIKSSMMFKEYHRQMRLRAEDLLALPDKRIMFIGEEMTPYFQAYLMQHFESQVTLQPYPRAFAGYESVGTHNHKQIYQFYYGSPTKAYLEKAIENGYTVVALEESSVQTLHDAQTPFIRLSPPTSTPPILVPEKASYKKTSAITATR